MKWVFVAFGQLGRRLRPGGNRGYGGCVDINGNLSSSQFQFFLNWHSMIKIYFFNRIFSGFLKLWQNLFW